jgi:hypothetical protein
MKTLLNIGILIVLSYSILGQDNELYKTWVDNHGNLFKIDSTQITHDGLNIYFPTYKYKQYNDTLLLRPFLYWNDSRFEDVIFLIKKVTIDSLILKPLSSMSNKIGLGENESTIRLVDYKLVKNDSFKFEKIYFSSTTCMGNCPGMEILIDSSRNVLFIGKANTGLHQGYFIGKLSKRKFYKLIDILKKYPIDYLPENYGYPLDAPEHYLIIWYNDSSKSMVGYINLKLTNYLIRFLSSVYKKIRLHRTFKKFEIP